MTAVQQWADVELPSAGASVEIVAGVLAGRRGVVADPPEVEPYDGDPGPRVWVSTDGGDLVSPLLADLKIEHRHAGGWKGEPGDCGASCSCGVTFAGFETLGEASALVDAHIERESKGVNGCPAASPDGSSGGSTTATCSASTSPEETSPAPDPSLSAPSPTTPTTSAAAEQRETWAERMARDCTRFNDGEVSRALTIASRWTDWAQQLDELLDAMPDRPGVMWQDAGGDTNTVELGTAHLDELAMRERMAVLRGQADALAAAYLRGADKAAAGARRALEALREDSGGESDG
ncbi:hypothetical protein BBK82_05140 [Lentzea guizhouensis]|uniref:Uncharacterized protein n=1 Tax=Lentzea guizhouensis TaxID=1586287 RepID=A0A1B2HCX2_9PSEU|nr:hypothetical protein [Lentzea guizhouensis]ANZ35558.1 hypothetical protein BBK82_05140 [Lentzea guizhouensis]